MPLNCPIVLAVQTPAQTVERGSDNIRGYGDRGRDDQIHTHNPPGHGPASPLHGAFPSLPWMSHSDREHQLSISSQHHGGAS